MGKERLPRPSPKTPYAVKVLNKAVQKDWEKMLETRRERATDCWDHISSTPYDPIGTRYVPLHPPLNTFPIGGNLLPVWQYEIDRGARVKVAVGQREVTVVRVSLGHPKENE
jgi:hypothetical protein